MLKDVSLEVAGNRLILRFPRNDSDYQFITSFKYVQWNAALHVWIVPNYKNNLQVISNYFAQRLQPVLHRDVESLELQPAKGGKVASHVLLLVKTRTQRLRLIFAFNQTLTNAIKKQPFANWDSKNRWWTVPFSESIVESLTAVAQELKLEVRFEEEDPELNKKPRITPYDVPNYRNCPESFINKLRELRYSENTIKTYVSLFEEFINYYYHFEIYSIDEQQIISFLRYLVTERKVSVSYQNQSINAIKFYYERVLGSQRKIYLVDRPRKERTLPVVLSPEEVQSILVVVANLKHRAILTTIYSAGLRVSEAIHLTIHDIDSSRMQIRVVQSKGNKDRYTLLSPKTLELLRAYFLKYKPKKWLFEGPEGKPYSDRSIQCILRDAVSKTAITKRVTVHTLRHSFATHLLENGTDLRYIQSLLGHESSRTTEIYTHITTRGFNQIKSPLDALDV